MSLVPNPYALIAGGITLLSVAGTIGYQNVRIHHFHTLYDQSQQVVAVRDATIKGMTTAQNEQAARSNGNIIKVIQGPKEVQSIIREVRSAPSSKDCKAPTYSDEVKNAF
jgi:hypothetical protein